MRRKYYDDCAQILSEHLLAAFKPAALKRLSTLDPLVTTRLNQLDEAVEEKKGENSFLSRAARMLQGEPNHADEGDPSVAGLSFENGDDNALSRSPDAADTTAAATTLVEGALPVRDFPNALASMPASIEKGELDNEIHGKRTRSGSLALGTHQEELRCVLAIVRHGDRTPKQKLKLNMDEPHILGYFHDQYVRIISLSASHTVPN